MGLYAGIDLHANNSYLAVIDETDELVVAKRYRNDLGLICKALEPHRDEVRGIAVESTFNWYWLVDGLEAEGYRVHLVNTLAAQQYQGAQVHGRQDRRPLVGAHAATRDPADWLDLPQEVSEPFEIFCAGGAQLVRQRTASRLGLRNILERTTARRLTTNGHEEAQCRGSVAVDRGPQRTAVDGRLAGHDRNCQRAGRAHRANHSRSG